MRRRPEVDVAPGERLLAHAELVDGAGVVGATREALYLPQRLAWHDVATAEWDQDEQVLRVVEVAPYGEVQPAHVVGLVAPDRLLQLVRERITASFVLQRWVEVDGGAGVRVLGRRPPTGGEVRWFVEYDAGLDPADPQVARVAAVALADARAETGS